MRAFQITGPGASRIVDIPKPEAGAGEVLLKVNRVGFCGSDLSTYLGKNPLAGYPRIPGHEIAATVEACGSGVPETYAPGTDVAVVPYTNCGSCAACLRGRPNACRSNQTLGVQRDGGMTEYIRLPWQKLVEAPGLSLEKLVLVEPLTVGFHAVDRGTVSDLDTVLVIGCGMIGLGAVVRSALRGATVVAADVDDEKLSLARELGAAHAVNVKTENLHEALETLTGGSGPDAVIEAVGSPATYRSAVEEVAFTGRIVCIGYAKEDAALPTRLFVQKELDIRGTRNASPSDFRAVVKYLQNTPFPVDRVVSREVDLDHAGETLAAWAENPGSLLKIVTRFD